ncbi:hypothetical protein SESBI_30802 [Sesbania bispinosa]|nr:hypothetical protein SESBI_30802 [Sesbania bispinosa]
MAIVVAALNAAMAGRSSNGRHLQRNGLRRLRTMQARAITTTTIPMVVEPRWSVRKEIPAWWSWFARRSGDRLGNLVHDVVEG